MTSPQAYHEWAGALVEAGCMVEIDALKIGIESALAIVRMLPPGAPGVRVVFYNCGTIPWDLLQIAGLGGSRVGFRM